MKIFKKLFLRFKVLCVLCVLCLIVVVLAIAALLPLFGEFLLYRRIVSGYQGERIAEFDIGFFITQKTWKRIVPKLIYEHARAVEKSRNDSNEHQINVSSYNKQLDLWNALLDAHRIANSPEIVGLIDSYFVEYIQSGDIRSDEFDNLVVLIRGRHNGNFYLYKLTALVNSSPYAKNANGNLINAYDAINTKPVAVVHE